MIHFSGFVGLCMGEVMACYRVVFVASDNMRLVVVPAWRTGGKVLLLYSDDTQCRKSLLF